LGALLDWQEMKWREAPVGKKKVDSELKELEELAVKK
jgi:hypothetical protein